MDKLQVFTSGKLYYLRDQKAYDPFLKYFLVPSCFIEFNFKFLLSCGHFHLVKHLPFYLPPFHTMFVLHNFSVFFSRGWLPGFQYRGAAFCCVFTIEIHFIWTHLSNLRIVSICPLLSSQTKQTFLFLWLEWKIFSPELNSH